VTINELRDFLLVCVGINYAVLLVWSSAFVFSHDWMYRLHGRWFRLSVETFDAVHYSGLAIYKVGILLLNLAPLVALYMVA
jgi:hypothetical protein